MYMEIQDKNNCIKNAGVKEGFKGNVVPFVAYKIAKICLNVNYIVIQ